jgi:hypothetical protein
MPPRNAPLPNAVNLFNCAICDKGYPRQTDYENHLRSYDHNHRQRLAEMKKLTDANATDTAPRPAKASLDMRALPQGDAAKALGPRFKKVAGAAAATGGSRFRKIGEVKEDEKKKEEGVKGGVAVEKKEAPLPVAADVPVKASIEADKDGDVVMGDDEDDDAVTWEEYDVTRPSGCDHASCLGCAVPANPVYENGWLVVGPA